MSTKIEWTDETWNPTTGCTKVSPGCDHCYAKTMHERFNGPDSFETVTLHPERLDLPLRWRKPRKVFVNSMSDLFHDDIPNEYIARVWAVMAATPQHTYQVLTKRHGRMRSLLSSPAFDLAVATEWSKLGTTAGSLMEDHTPPYPLPNVWLGVSVENQQWADIRIPALLDTPAVVRFLSCEPLLGPVDLRVSSFIGGDWLKGLHWAIVGGESGHGARPMHPDWARELRDQCVDAEIPFLFKQWGAWGPTRWIGAGTDGTGRIIYVPDSEVSARPDAHPIEGRQLERMGKGKAGRVLDGRTWDEFPEAAS